MTDNPIIIDSEDSRLMRKALSLARRTWPSPNPRVGAIIVKDGVIVGRGRHLHYGGAHAEVYALQKAGQKAYSATVYVTLEPCSHHGRTGPCAEALIEAGVSRVVAGCIDPNPNVAGQGVAMLRAAGIDVVTGVEEERARRLIAGHARFMTVGLPYVVWKYAISLDGRVATSSGESRWVTGEQSRREVHRMRCNADAVVIGIGTALTDDPELTVRGVVDNHQPKRVVLDSNGRLPLHSRLLNSPGGAVIVVVSSNCPQANQRRLQDAGASVVSAGESRVDVRQALQMLANHFDIREILLESGPELAASMVGAGLVQEAVCFIAGKLIGGREAPGPLGGGGLDTLADASLVEISRVRRFGDDVALYGKLSR